MRGWAGGEKEGRRGGREEEEGGGLRGEVIGEGKKGNTCR